LDTASLTRRLGIGLVLGLAVVLGLGLLADLPRLIAALSRWQWSFLPLVVAAVLANYGLRFLRWHYYLHVVGVHDVTSPVSLAIFLSGFALTMTPGKLGEVLKSFLLRQVNETPVSYSASLVVAERLTDVLAMVLLAALGLGAFQAGWQALLIVSLCCLALIVVVQQRELCLHLLDVAGRLPWVGRFAGLARNLYESSYLLLQWRPLLAATLVAVLAWFGECLAFYLVLVGLGTPGAFSLLFQATFIYATASLLGALSFLPGGLGATEGSMALMLTQLTGLTRDPAIAATLLIRFATLWFAVLLGVFSLLFFQRRLATT
jgi:uncharacterized membrane protein YbhN (UPF0104 family)